MSVTPRLARTAWGCLETLHVVGFFAPQVQAGYDRYGVGATRAGYFGARAAPFGACGPELVEATFYVFAPRLVRAAVPAIWDAATPQQWARARADGSTACLREALGDEVQRLDEPLALARRACEGLRTAGRPISAAWSAQPWPDDPVEALWHAALLLREHRGDGHVTALVASGLDPVEALVTGGIDSGSYDFVRVSRGWSDDDWAAGLERTRARGLVAREVDDDGTPTLTAAGRELRARVETLTDELAVDGWSHLGEEGTERLVELVTPLRQRLLGSGVLPDWVASRG